MLIFLLPAIFPDAENAQRGIYIYEQCEVLKRHGHEIVILDCTSRNYRDWKKCGRYFKYRSPVGEVYGCHIRGLAQSRLPRLAVFTYTKKIGKVFKQAIKEYGRPDFIYAHFAFPCGYAARLLSKKYKIPYIVQEHYSLFLSKKLPKYLINITKKTVEDAASFYCVSEALKNNVKRLTKTDANIGVVYNLVNDRYRFYPTEKRDKFTFFSAGNLVKSKKFDLLIEAFSEAFKKNEPVELRIAGCGEECENLKRLIEKKGCGEQIKLLGRLCSDEMLSEYKGCHCFVLLSEYETFGIVYREAMAVGRPVIAAKNGGAEENWSNDFGILVEKDDPVGSAQALVSMYENNDRYNREKISLKNLKFYSSDNIYSRLEKEFGKITQ